MCLLCRGSPLPPQGTSSSSGRSPSPAPGRSGRRRSSRRHPIGRAAAEAGSWSLAPDPAAGRGSTTTTASPRAARSPPRSKVPQFCAESVQNSSSSVALDTSDDGGTRSLSRFLTVSARCFFNLFLRRPRPCTHRG